MRLLSRLRHSINLKVILALTFGISTIYWAYTTSDSHTYRLATEMYRESIYDVRPTTKDFAPDQANTATAAGNVNGAVSNPTTDQVSDNFINLSGVGVLTSASAYTYVEVTDSCGPYFEDECVNIRSGPGTDYPIINKLRKGAVLKVDNLIPGEDGKLWYEITFDEWVRYPERQEGTWYIAADFVREFQDIGEQVLDQNNKHTTEKAIIVDRSEQKLYAYDGDELFMEETISTGRELAPTPIGTFTAFKMTPSRYMQGPIPGITDQKYDLPGVPWAIYFTAEGAAIHGAYWHDNFGTPWSNGCVNLPPEKARELYDWAELGMKVTIRE